jgi:hypothetical protein
LLVARVIITCLRRDSIDVISCLPCSIATPHAVFKLTVDGKANEGSIQTFRIFNFSIKRNVFARG